MPTPLDLRLSGTRLLLPWGQISRSSNDDVMRIFHRFRQRIDPRPSAPSHNAAVTERLRCRRVPRTYRVSSTSLTQPSCIRQDSWMVRGPHPTALVYRRELCGPSHLGEADRRTVYRVPEEQQSGASRPVVEMDSAHRRMLPKS